jgi:hypothetical protein
MATLFTPPHRKSPSPANRMILHKYFRSKNALVVVPARSRDMDHRQALDEEMAYKLQLQQNRLNSLSKSEK